MAKPRTKTETFSIRLDPQTRYLAELAARSQGRSLANFIQKTVEDTLENTVIQRYAKPGQRVKARSREFIDMTWAVDEPERLVKLALTYKELMTFEEQVLYNRLVEAYLKKDANTPRTQADFDWSKIREDWAKLKELTNPR